MFAFYGSGGTTCIMFYVILGFTLISLLPIPVMSQGDKVFIYPKFCFLDLDHSYVFVAFP